MPRSVGVVALKVGLLGLLLVGLLAFPAQQAAAATPSPVGCNGNNLSATFSKVPTTAVTVGTTITYSITITNNDVPSSAACDVTNLTASMKLPDGTVIPLVSNVSLPANGAPIASPGGPECVTAGPYTYVASAADQVTITSGPGSCRPRHPPGVSILSLSPQALASSRMVARL